MSDVGFLVRSGASSSSLLLDSGSHKLGDGFASSHSRLLFGCCSLPSGALISQTCHGFGTFLSLLISLFIKAISVLGDCWWEELGTFWASSALWKRYFSGSEGFQWADLTPVNEHELVSGTVVATFSQFRNPFLARQCKVCTKGGSAAEAPLWNCTPSPEHFGWAVITCTVLLDFSKVSLYPY